MDGQTEVPALRSSALWRIGGTVGLQTFPDVDGVTVAHGGSEKSSPSGRRALWLIPALGDFRLPLCSSSVPSL